MSYSQTRLPHKDRWKRVALFLLLLTPLACLGSPSRIRTPPRDYLSDEPPSRIWATYSDGSEQELRWPSLAGDTLVATSVGGRVVIVPMDRVMQVRARQTSVVRSAVLVGIIGAAGVLFSVRIDPNKSNTIDSTQFYICRINPTEC